MRLRANDSAAEVSDAVRQCDAEIRRTTEEVKGVKQINAGYVDSSVCACNGDSSVKNEASVVERTYQSDGVGVQRSNDVGSRREILPVAGSGSKACEEQGNNHTRRSCQEPHSQKVRRVNSP